MTKTVISVLTYKSVETILQTGGTQSWALDKERARNCDYAVVCRNARTRDAEGPEPHGSAFMVAKIKDVVPSTDNDGRWLILFSEYAIVDWPDQWEGRNPVAYWNVDQYDEYADEFETLKFEKMPAATVASSLGQSLTIPEAKQALAKSLGVSIDAIEITIRA